MTDGGSIVLDVPTPECMHTLGAALGRAARVPIPVSSPSFVIENQYRGRLMLYHVDLYRLEHVEAELWESLEEHLYGDGVTAVEWAERLPDHLRDGATLLRFELCEPARRIALVSPEARLRSAAAAA